MTPEENLEADVTGVAEPGVLLPMSEVAAISPSAAGESALEYLVSDSFDAVLVELYRTHAKALLAMLWVFVGDGAEAEDLSQAAFIRLHRSWRRFHPNAHVCA